MLREHEDAFGQSMFDFYSGKGGYEVVERDDGLVAIAGGPRTYLAEYKDWSVHQKKALRFARGKVLDIGCGAGRHAFYLQEKGLDVLGVDASPLAIKICKLRGLRKTKLLSITQLTRSLGTFDTMLMLGNNFGLFGSFGRARWLLKRFYRMTSDEARIIAETRDPYGTDDPCHLAYHKLNRKRGRMSGQLRIRIRYKTYATPWFDYLLVSKDEMRAILDGTGWQVTRFMDTTDPAYVAAIIGKQQ
jgi:hypothetical protein